MTKKRTKKVLATGYFLLVTGILGLIWPFLSLNVLDNVTFLKKLSSISAKASSMGENSIIIGDFSPTPTPNDNLMSIKNRLLIEKININLALIISNDSNTLFKGGWILKGSPTPETGNNFVIFGHRFKYLPPISNTLYNLDKISIGDEFKIIWNEKIYKYRVIENKIVEPEDLSVLNPSEKSIVTIITCSPLFSTQQRLVVVGEMI